MAVFRTFNALLTLVSVELSLKTIGLDPLLQKLEDRFDKYPRVTASAETMSDLANAYHAAARLYPRHLQCLPRAISVYIMARRAGIDIVLTIGVRKIPFLSHAWVKGTDYVFLEDPRIIATLTPLVVLR